jgi:hypothetical protein
MLRFAVQLGGTPDCRGETGAQTGRGRCGSPGGGAGAQHSSGHACSRTSSTLRALLAAALPARRCDVNLEMFSCDTPTSHRPAAAGCRASCQGLEGVQRIVSRLVLVARGTSSQLGRDDGCWHDCRSLCCKDACCSRFLAAFRCASGSPSCVPLAPQPGRTPVCESGAES